MPDPLGGSVEDIFVEIYARADKLIAEAKKARDSAVKTLEEIGGAAKKTEGSFDVLGVAILGAIGGIAAKAGMELVKILKKMAQIIPSIVKQAVGMASAYESVEMTFNRLLGSQQKSAEFLDALRVQAAAVGQNFVTMAQAAKSFLPYAEGSKDAFLDMIQAQMGLAAADPMQGMIGAAMALREFLSGTYQSLAMRFELPRQKLRQILKDHQDVESRMKALNELLEQFGMGFALVGEQAGTLPGIMGQIKGAWDEALLALGQPIMEELKNHAADLLEVVIENKEEIINAAMAVGEFIASFIRLTVDVIPILKDILLYLTQIDEVMHLLDEAYILLNRGNEEWGASALTTLKQVSFMITNFLLVNIADIWFTFKAVWNNIKALVTSEEVIPWEQITKGRKEVRRATREMLYEKFFGPREEEVIPAAEPEDEEEKPFELGEKAQKALAAGAAKIEAIFKKFQKRIEKLRRDHAKKMASIDAKEIKDQLKARAKYDKDADKLQVKFQKQQIKAEQDYHKERIDEQEDFNKKWARLIRDQHQEVLDADWDFRFQEEHLIAEGDTLALRDLRLRYAHEKEVRAREQQDTRSDTEDDRRVQEDDRRRDFQEAQAERDSDYREQLLALQTTFGEQLALISQNAEEARQKERANLAERSADAKQSRDEELVKIGEWLANVKSVSAEELAEIQKIWAEVYGEIADTAIQEGLRAHQERMRLLGLEKQEALALAAAYSQVGARGEERATPRSQRGGYGYEGPVRPLPRRRAQFGLNEVFNQPTNILVGEGGLPEHVQVTPLTGGFGGGRMGVDISGNITVGGSALSPEAASELIVVVAGAIQGAVESKMEAGV